MTPLALLAEGILIAFVILGLATFFAWRIARAGGLSETLSLPSRIILTAALLGLIVYSFKQGRTSKASQAIALFTVLLAAVPFVVMWLPQVIETVLSPFFGSMTGGNEQVEPRPMYFRAIGLRKRGDFTGALAAAEAELAQFPQDVEGRLLIADIQSHDLKNPLAAVTQLQEAILTPGLDAGGLSLLLSRVADLQLNQLNNPDAARGAYRRIIDEFPGTEAAKLATQRLAHLPGEAQLLERAERPKLVVTHHETRVGLEDATASAGPTREQAVAQARVLVEHLAQFPDDWESREQLAQLYASALGRPELAEAELEQLIQQPDIPARQVARWLNELAEIQLKTPAGADAAKPTFERIVALFPGTPWAEQAESRLRLLGLDRRGKEATRTLKLGHYEQNIGLKRGDPSIPDPARGAV